MIREAGKEDISAIAEMAVLLWNDNSVEDLIDEFSGIIVKEESRHKGYAKELLAWCEKWARKKGCKEFASDCETDNNISLQFHKAVGFTEANRIICFTKKL